MTAWLPGGTGDLNCDCFRKDEVFEQLVSQRDGLKPELRGAIMAGHGVLCPMLNLPRIFCQ